MRQSVVLSCTQQAEEAALFKLGRSRVRHLTQLSPFSLACVTGNNAQPCRLQRSVERRGIVVELREALLRGGEDRAVTHRAERSEEHTSELQSLMRISYAVFCLKKKNNTPHD